MASPPFNPNEAVPADNSLVSAYPAAERTFRDIVESWLLFEHGRSGHHTFLVVDTATRNADTTWEQGSLVYNTDDLELQIVIDTGPLVWASVISFSEPVQGTTSVAGVFEKATTAEVYAATADKAIAADLLETASAEVTITDAAPVALDWDTFINGTVTVTADRQISNPTNGQVRTWRTLLVKGNSSTDRTITFGTQYLGAVPTITDCDDATWYLLTIVCITTTHFAVSAKKVKG